MVPLKDIPSTPACLTVPPRDPSSTPIVTPRDTPSTPPAPPVSQSDTSFTPYPYRVTEEADYWARSSDGCEPGRSPSPFNDSPSCLHSVRENGEESCKELMESYHECLRALGIKV
uniref:Uncharacterized protein n=1 Tax=Chelonoidis abingdonii TaxID=106734 RepID=A0A8C0GSM7_CHEAB